MRRDCRGPSSSSTMSRAGLREASAPGAGWGSEIVSKRETESVAVEAVIAVHDGPLSDGPARAVGVLVGEEPVEMIVLPADAGAENVAIGVRDRGVEAGSRHGVFAVDVAGAGAESAAQFFADAEFV